MQSSIDDRARVAVIGTGISGLSAAWLLSQRCEVTVFESAGRVGGHSNTVEVQAADRTIPVDTGFVVFNTLNYPNLTALFEFLGVETKASDMSLSLSLDNGALEYSGANLPGLFAQRSNLFNPRFWSMLRDVARFYRQAPRDLASLDPVRTTLGRYLSAQGFGHAFREDHLLPMAAAGAAASRRRSGWPRRSPRGWRPDQPGRHQRTRASPGKRWPQRWIAGRIVP